MDADDFVLSNARFPWSGGGALGLLEPDDQARFVTGTNKICIAITVHVKGFPVNEGMVLVIANDDLLPVRRNKEARLATATTDDIHLAIAGKICSYRHIAPLSFPYNVFLPIAF